MASGDCSTSFCGWSGRCFLLPILNLKWLLKQRALLKDCYPANTPTLSCGYPATTLHPCLWLSSHHTTCMAVQPSQGHFLSCLQCFLKLSKTTCLEAFGCPASYRKSLRLVAFQPPHCTWWCSLLLVGPKELLAFLPFLQGCRAVNQSFLGSFLLATC